MNRRVLAITVIVAIVAGAVLLYFGLKGNDERILINVEDVGGKYNTTLSFYEEGWVGIEYTDQDGKHSDKYFMVELRNGLDWIKANILENATFLCWWDYGHMVKGYAERETIVRNPSEEILESVGDPSSITEFDPHERIVDVATALTTNNSTEIMQILEKYDVTHILVCSDDLGKVVWFYRIAGLDETEYVSGFAHDQIFTEAGKQTMIAKLLENRDTGFTLIYEDEEIKVYVVD